MVEVHLAFSAFFGSFGERIVDELPFVTCDIFPPFPFLELRSVLRYAIHEIS